MLCELTVLGEK